MWIKNNEIIQSSDKYFIEFRNGVCRLTILQAFPSKFHIFLEFLKKLWTEIFNVSLILADAATYGCIVKNSMGSDSTSAVLMVSNLGMRHWIEKEKI